MKKNIFILIIFFYGLNIYSQNHLKCLASNDSVLWHHKNFETDRIPGISLEKWKIINKKKTKNKIVVAVIDTRINYEHEDLKNQIWVNKKEIPNNNIDDDNNGYVDDVNGWNFIGHKNGIDTSIWMNFEYVRILKSKNLKNKFLNNSFNDFQYKKAVIKFKEDVEEYKNLKVISDYFTFIYLKAKIKIKEYFKNNKYTINQLDSLYEIKKSNDKDFFTRCLDKDTDLGAMINALSYIKKIDFDDFKKIEDERVQNDSIILKNLNLEFNDRIYIGDNDNYLEEGYGNKNIGNMLKKGRNFNQHSTIISGIIAATNNNNIGINGFSNNITIMPLAVTCSGDENDKDITMAIKYAIDNGAKIINMSFSKEFSLNKIWVDDMLKYAEKKNVLIIHSAGNLLKNIDDEWSFPSDYDYLQKKEFVNNFITVGGYSINLKNEYKLKSTNYGKSNVDLFAPGISIYSTDVLNTYSKNSGTSFAAPMVSGTAALIWLYYPKLTAKQVKEIILESSTKYDIEVIVPGTTDKKVKFSELSKSGGVLNVYDAMKLAEKVSQQN